MMEWIYDALVYFVEWIYHHLMVFIGVNFIEIHTGNIVGDFFDVVGYIVISDFLCARNTKTIIKFK